MRKFTGTVAAVLTCLLFPQAGQAQEGKFDVSLAFGNPVVNNLPLEIRNVPIHPDDSGVPGPVARTRYTMPVIASAGVRLIRRSNFTGRLRWFFYPNHGLGGDIARRNYTNAPGTEQRGEGAALTFVGLEVGGIFPAVDGLGAASVLLNVSPEAQWAFPLSRNASTRLISTASYYRIEAVSGWDRFNGLDVRDRYTLAHCLPVTVGIDTGRFAIGVQYPLISKTGQGKNADIKTQIAFLTTLRF